MALARQKLDLLEVKGRFPFYGLTGQTQIIFSVPMERAGLCFSNI
jgi:hypothetical protein